MDPVAKAGTGTERSMTQNAAITRGDTWTYTGSALAESAEHVDERLLTCSRLTPPEILVAPLQSPPAQPICVYLRK